MAIKLKKAALERAEISEEFLDAVQDIVAYRLDEVKSLFERMNDRVKAQRKHDLIARTAAMRAALGEDGRRSGREYLATLFRGLPYSKFGVTRFDNRLWLAGRTHDIIISHQTQGTWNLGEYGVFFDVQHMKDTNYAGIHMVPVRDHNEYARHPHHRVSSQDRNVGMHPLRRTPHTCWGNFPTIVSNCVTDADIVELFRTINLFLVRWNPGSPLAYINDITHKRAAS
jgi:hypothetical protein